MPVKSYRDLIAWQKAMDLTKTIYDLTAGFPTREIYGLTSQIRRAAVSVPSNIAEGQGRQTTRDFLNFLSIAYGSLCELETQIILSERLGYLVSQSSHQASEEAAEVGRLINGLSKSLRDIPSN